MYARYEAAGRSAENARHIAGGIKGIVSLMNTVTRNPSRMQTNSLFVFLIWAYKQSHAQDISTDPVARIAEPTTVM